MTPCGARDTRDTGHAHSCVGNPGHHGPHWCLLGHIWANENEEESASA